MKKLAVITGAGGVLCSHMAEALAKDGYRLALLNRTLEKAEAVAERIKADGGSAKAYYTDVRERSTVEDARRQVLRDFGTCDILINGAGGTHPSGMTDSEYAREEDMHSAGQSFFNLSAEGFDYVFGLNMTGTVIPSQVFSIDMAGRRDCSIINISSMGALSPLTRSPAYSAAKAGVTNFTQWLAVHFAPMGIRVNAIAPGFFITAQNRNVLLNPDGSLTKRAEKILKGTPMNRFGDPKELCGTMLWLADSRQSGFVTGVVIPVDGGFSAYGGV